MIFDSHQLMVQVCGECDVHIRFLEQRLGVTLHPRGNSVVITGPQQARVQARRALASLCDTLAAGHPLEATDLGAEMAAATGRDPMAPPDDSLRIPAVVDDTLRIHTPCRTITPRTPRQGDYIRQLLEGTLTFGTGPAGTGKTYLAVAVAVHLLFAGDRAGRATPSRRIVLTRPVVEAGEHLGFLPGDLNAKVDPYLRPLYDALYDTVGAERVERLLQQRTLEIAPLAYMRGRTLEDAFVILDEAQNTTVEQMRMFLTRLGHRSRMVVCGDPTQVDLPGSVTSGLSHAVGILHTVGGIGFTRFTGQDIVRHPLVRRIVQAYERSPKGGVALPSRR
jgi:phosphate starvation-inducible PhoH-like protein